MPPLRHHALLIALCYSLFTIATEGSDVLLSDFSGATDPTLEMITINDPVMGGKSESTAEQKEDCLVWEGEVKIVDFLNAPGFCILENEPTKLPPLSDTSGISFWVHSGTDFMKMSAVAQTDFKKFGFRVQYEAALEPLATGGGGLIELHAKWENFKPTLMGRDVEAPKLEGEELDKVQVLGMSTYKSHKAGKFRLELVKIVATEKGGGGDTAKTDRWLTKARNLRDVLSFVTRLGH